MELDGPTAARIVLTIASVDCGAEAVMQDQQDRDTYSVAEFVTAHPPFRETPWVTIRLRIDQPEEVLDAVTAESILSEGCPSFPTSTT
jgi:hypothetical protein